MLEKIEHLQNETLHLISIFLKMFPKNKTPVHWPYKMEISISDKKYICIFSALGSFSLFPLNIENPKDPIYYLSYNFENKFWENIHGIKIEIEEKNLFKLLIELD